MQDLYVSQRVISDFNSGMDKFLRESGGRIVGRALLVHRDYKGRIIEAFENHNIETTQGKAALAAYLANSSPTAPFMKYQEVGTKGTTTSSSITGNSTSAGPTIAVGADITGATSPSVIQINGGGNVDTVGVTVSGTTYTFANTTIASGSNGVVLGTNNSIVVAATTNFIDPVATGIGTAYAQIVISAASQVISYTSIDATHLKGVQLVGAAAGTLATGQVVNQNPQNSYSGISTVTLAPQKGDTGNKTPLSSRQVGTLTTPGSTNIWQNQYTFNTNSYVGSITEAALYDASSSGNCFAHQTFGVITYGTGDSLQITWQVTFP